MNDQNKGDSDCDEFQRNIRLLKIKDRFHTVQNLLRIG